MKYRNPSFFQKKKDIFIYSFIALKDLEEELILLSDIISIILS